jgi:hypothetical protein
MTDGEVCTGFRFTESELPSLVTTGLDPVVHAEVRLSMDCQVFARQ